MMKKFKYIVLLALLCAFGSASAQNNTASAGGDWNNCATWGNPTAIYQNATDTKTINSGVTVTQNTVWSTGAIQLNGNGAVVFANSGNAVVLGADNGADQNCIVFQLNCSGATQTGTVTQGNSYPAGPSSSAVNKTVSYSGGTGASYGAQSIASTGVSGLTATAPAGTLSFSSVIVFRITGTPSGAGTANFLINIGGQACTFTVTVNPVAPKPTANFTASGACTNGFNGYNVAHSGGNNSDVTITSTGFRFNTAGTYTIITSVNITSRYGPGFWGNGGGGVYTAPGGEVAWNMGVTNITQTVTVAAGSTMYFWILTPIGDPSMGETHLAFTASGTIKRN